MRSITLTPLFKSVALLFILPFGFVTSVSAQDNKEEETKGEMKIKIITSINGNTKIVEQTLQPGDEYMMEEMSDSFPQIKAMAKMFGDSASAFSYSFNYDIEKEMEKLSEQMGQFNFNFDTTIFNGQMNNLKDFEFNWDTTMFNRQMENLNDIDFTWDTAFNVDISKMQEEIEKSMEGMRNGLSKSIIINGDEIDVEEGEDRNVQVSENGDTVKISINKRISIGDENAAATDKKVKVIVIEEESDGKEGEEPEIKVIKKVIKIDNKNQSTGMNDIAEDAALRVYPNPSSGKITVNFKPDSKKKTQLKVTDEAGRVVYSEEIKTASEITHEIDLGNEAKGIYFVELAQGKKKIVNRIILK